MLGAPDQSHIVHVAGFPKEWTTTRLLDTFGPTWGPVSVTWIVRTRRPAPPRAVFPPPVFTRDFRC